MFVLSCLLCAAVWFAMNTAYEVVKANQKRELNDYYAVHAANGTRPTFGLGTAIEKQQIRRRNFPATIGSLVVIGVMFYLAPNYDALLIWMVVAIVAAVTAVFTTPYLFPQKACS
jgi:mannose/fructose/N-acetylgalactosamine-specific phosphotransferase system component IID